MKKILLFMIVLLTTFLGIESTLVNKTFGQQLSAVDDLPTFSHEGGFYTEDFHLSLIPKPNTTIYYTLDGSEPNTDSLIYHEPIWIESTYIEPTGEERLIQNQIPTHLEDPIPSPPISFIRTGSQKWNSPTEPIFKATIIKAKAINGSGQESPVVTHSYFVDPEIFEKYTFPIISITTDIDNLYGYRNGINVPGFYYDPAIEESSNQNRTGNYFERGVEWEKPVFIEYFEKDGTKVIAQEAGLRVHGGLSRKYPIKSYRLYARSEYDETTYFNYSFFEDQDIDRFKRIVLRGGGQTYEYTFMGEAAAQGLLKEMNLDIQYSTPVILFMNGEYFGIRNIRDRLDDWYVQIKYDVPRQDVTILSGHGSLSEGTIEGQRHYLDMYRFITRNDMSSKRNYDHVNTLMDVENYIDYYVAQLYFANVDWPQNNIEYWRYNTSYSPQKTVGQDGRWRWMVFDVDAGFGASWGGYYPEYNSMERMTGDSWKTGSMFTSLLKNTQFRHQFINRMMDLLNTHFSSEYAREHVQDMINLYAPEMREHIAYYGYPRSYNTWLSYTNRMLTFANDRPTYLIHHVKDYFDLGNTFQLSVKSNQEQGFIKVNTLKIGQSMGDSTWKGTYFKDVPIQLTAMPNTGYRLVGWYNESNELLSQKLNYTLDPNEQTYVHAIYEEGIQVYPEEEVAGFNTGLFITVTTSLISIFALLIYIDFYRKRKI